MQVSVETTQGLERRMTVALPSDDIDSAVRERLQNLSKTTRMNGFRPGKVPFNVVKKRFEPQVRSEVLGSMINRSYYDAVVQEKLRPAGQPEITPSESDSEDAEIGFSFVATFEVYPEFEPVYNDNIKVARPAVEITEDDVKEMLDSLRKQRTDYQAVERASQEGDQILIDFVGRIDGEAFEGGSAENTPLLLGSDSMIPGFESQLIGVSAGDEKTIQVTFPADYQAEHLAGKETDFDIVVHEVRAPQIPEFDEEMVRSFGIEDGSLDSLKADIRKNMERELKQRVDAQVKNQVMDGLVALNQIDVPSALVKEEIKRQREQLMKQMPADTDASFIGDELFADQALRRVRLGLVVGEIIQRQEIKADDDAVRQQIQQIAASYQEPEQIVQHYYDDPDLLGNIEGLVLEDKVISLVLEQCTVVDEPTSFHDLMNPKPAEPPAEHTDAEPGAEQSTEE